LLWNATPGSPSSATEMLLAPKAKLGGAAWPAQNTAPAPVHPMSGEAMAHAWRRGLQSPVQNAAEDAVAQRVHLLDRLHKQIAAEQKHVEEMREQEQKLAAKHAEVQAQVEHLTRSSRASASDIHNLRNRYLHKVRELQQEEKMQREHIEDQRVEVHRRIRGLEQDASDLGAGLAKDVAKADYYRSQDAEAARQIEEMEGRAKQAREQEVESRTDLDAARLATLSKRVLEAQAVAKEKVARVVAEEHGQAVRKAVRARRELNTAKEKLLVESAQAKAAVHAAIAAHHGVHHAQHELDEVEEKVARERRLYREEVAKTQNLKSRAIMAEDHARLVEKKTDKAEAELEDLRSTERDKWEQAQEAIAKVETAEGDEAVAKTRGQVVHRESQEAVAEALRVRERATREEQMSRHRLDEAEKGMREMTHRKEVTMVGAVKSMGHARRGDAELAVAEKRRRTAKTASGILQARAQHTEEKAEGLMHSLGALAALARQAARVADQSRVKAQVAVGIDPTAGCEGKGCAK